MHVEIKIVRTFCIRHTRHRKTHDLQLAVNDIFEFVFFEIFVKK